VYIYIYIHYRFEDEDVVNLMDGARSSSPIKAKGKTTDSGGWEFVGGEEDQDRSSSEEGPEGKPKKNALTMHFQKYSI
jgi:hypothetical protein